MEMITSVNFRGALAHFIIRRDSPGIYYADLVNYEGDESKGPPKGITLMRGIRQWTGSYQDDFLLLKLGQAIEDVLNEIS
jgi:hypothetical protein